MTDDLDRDLDLDVDLDEALAPVVEFDVLPVGFPLPRLVKFVPDPAKRLALDDAVVRALAVDVTGPSGLAAADVALGEVRGRLAVVRREFDEPRRLAHELHTHITRRLAEWTEAADAALKVLGQRVWAETRRLDALAAEDRRRSQDAADAAERDRIARAADAAAAADAPPSLVADLRRESEVATAPPVPDVEAAGLATSSTVSTWKARPRGTPADADPNPAVGDMTPTQRAAVLDLVKAIAATGDNLTAIEINYKALNARAKADKRAFNVPGFEAFESGGVRAKGRRV